MSDLPECKSPLKYLFFLISVFISLIYSYNFVVLLRQSKLMKTKKNDMSIIFYLVTIISNIVYSLFYLSNIHIFVESDIYNKGQVLSTLITGNIFKCLQILSIVLYFNQIIKVLKILNVYGANVLRWISVILIIILVVSFLVQYISIYVYIPYLKIFSIHLSLYFVLVSFCLRLLSFFQN